MTDRTHVASLRPRVLVAQLGARRHYAVPRALDGAGLLETVVTELSADAVAWRVLERFVPAKRRPTGLQRLLARRVAGVSPRRVANLPLFAMSPWLLRRPGEESTDHWARRNAAFGRRIVARGFGAADAVYAFNGAALEIFTAARQRGLATVLDQTAAPWRWNRLLLEDEARRWPDWESGDGETDGQGVMAEREEAEWGLADAIVCGAPFAADAVSQSGVPVERCHIIPYAGHVASTMRRPTQARGNGPLRVLFVGTLQLRKGLPYLLEAVRAMPRGAIDLRFVGPTRLTAPAMSALAGVGEIVGPVPRTELARHYAWADVLVLPTLSEGSANVCYEAMAAGVPVVTTANAGSIVRHNQDGLIVPIRDAAALATALAVLAEDRGRLAAMAEAAHASLARLTLDGYGTALGAAIESAISLRRGR